MKKSLFLILAALLAWGGWAAPAGAQSDGFYLTPKLGVSFFSGDDRFETTIGTFSKRGHSNRFAGALALGYDFSTYGAPIRTELEFTMRAPFETESNGRFTDGRPVTSRNKMNIHTLMFNAYLDLETDTAFTPYLGAGLGVAFVKGSNYPTDTVTGEVVTVDGGNASHYARKFTWSLTGGTAVDLTDNLALDLGYRFFSFSDLTTGTYVQGSTYSGRPMLHEVMLGLRFSY